MKSRFNPLFKKPEAAAAIYIRALLPWIDSRGWLGTSGSQSGGLGIEFEVPVIAQAKRFSRPEALELGTRKLKLFGTGVNLGWPNLRTMYGIKYVAFPLGQEVLKYLIVILPIK